MEFEGILVFGLAAAHVAVQIPCKQRQRDDLITVNLTVELSEENRIRINLNSTKTFP